MGVFPVMKKGRQKLRIDMLQQWLCAFSSGELLTYAELGRWRGGSRLPELRFRPEFPDWRNDV